MQNILVTGAAGFIGLNLVNELIKTKNKVYVLIEKMDAFGKQKLRALDASIVIIDDFQDLYEKAGQYPKFNKIFHLATVGIQPDFNDIGLICDVNIKMGCMLVDIAKKNGSELLVNFGSCFEYGDHGEVLLTEEMECRPNSLYAISKNASTNLVSAYARNQNVNSITVRPFGVFGEGESENRLVPSIIRSCLNGKIVKTTKGEQIRDFVNVKDLVKAIIQLADSDYSSYEIYNICSDNPVSVKQLIVEILEVCGFDESLIEFGGLPYRKNEAMVFAGDNSKMQRIINYPFPRNHKDGILDIYNSIKNEA